MPVSLAKVWRCDYCLVKESQGGARGQSLPPIPPLGWYLVDVTWLQPKRIEKGTGEQRITARHILCPTCEPKIHPLLKQGNEA